MKLILSEDSGGNLLIIKTSNLSTAKKTLKKYFLKNAPVESKREAEQLANECELKLVEVI